MMSHEEIRTQTRAQLRFGLRSGFAAVALVVGASSALAGAACTRKKEEKSAATADSGAAPRGDRGGSSSAGEARRPPGVRRTLGAISVEEVAELMPTPDGARVVRAPAKAQIGERIEAAYCVDEGRPVAEVAEAVRQKYLSVGWSGAVTRPHATLPDRIAVSAQKPPYTLTGIVTKGGDPSCDGAKHQVFVSLGVHKIELQPIVPLAPAPPPPLPPFAPGPPSGPAAGARIDPSAGPGTGISPAAQGSRLLGPGGRIGPPGPGGAKPVAGAKQ